MTNYFDAGTCRCSFYLKGKYPMIYTLSCSVLMLCIQLQYLPSTSASARPVNQADVQLARQFFEMNPQGRVPLPGMSSMIPQLPPAQMEMFQMPGYNKARRIPSRCRWRSCRLRLCPMDGFQNSGIMQGLLCNQELHLFLKMSYRLRLVSLELF